MHGAGGSRRMIGKMLMLRLPRVVVDLWLPILCLLIAAGKMFMHFMQMFF